MVRATNMALSIFVDIYRALRKELSNRNILVDGARQAGKSTFQMHVMSDSPYFRTPEKTGVAGKVETYKIDYLGESYDSFKIKIQDCAGDRIHWADTVRRIVHGRPKVVIFMLRAFELRPDGQEVKKSEHLMRVPGLKESFRIMKLDNGMGGMKDVWYCGEDMDCFDFLRTLLWDHPNLHEKYHDVMSRCQDIHQKLFKNRKKIRPKFLYMVVNFIDTIPPDEIENRVAEILEPYRKPLMVWSENGVKVRDIAISAKHGHNIKQLLLDIGEDRKWT